MSIFTKLFDSDNDVVEADDDLMEEERATFQRLLSELHDHVTDLDHVRATADRLGDAALASHLPAHEVIGNRAAALILFADASIRDDSLDVAEAQTFMHIVNVLDIDDTVIDEADIRDVFNRSQVAAVNGMGVAEVYTDLFLTGGEIAVFEEYSSLMGVQRGKFVGQSYGFSFRVAQGVRFNTSWLEGGVVTPPELIVKDFGYLTLTTRRVVFRGESKTIECRLDKMVGVNILKDGISFNMTNRERVDLFKLVNAPKLAASINWILDQGEDVEARVHRLAN